MQRNELQVFIETERGQYLMAKALACAAKFYSPQEDGKDMANALIKYFPQFPELLNTNIVDDVILDTKKDDLSFWEAMAEVAWSATNDTHERRDES